MIDPSCRLAADGGALALILGVAVLGAAGATGPVTIVVTLLAVLLVPGWAALTRIDPGETLTALALAVALSLAAVTAGSLLMAWTGWWSPPALAASIGAGSAVLIAIDAARTAREDPPLLVRLRAALAYPGSPERRAARRVACARTRWP